MSLYSNSNRHSERGVTLLEMLTVLTVISIAIVLLAPLQEIYATAGSVRRDAIKIAAALRSSRAEALAKGESVDFEFDAASKKYGLMGEARAQVGSAANVKFTGARELRRSSGVGVIRFYPDGSASGGEIVISGKREIDTIKIDWLTGSPRIERKAPS